MSGFDPVWLDLREPADHRARNRTVRDACATRFAGRDFLRIVDLGCGSGSNLRALAPHLPDRQRWRLVDNDPGLLDAARARLEEWADETKTQGDRLLLGRSGKRIEVEFAQLDLARNVGEAWAEGADLVTASALFDLVSNHWMAALVEALSRPKTPLYAALTYNGREAWRPTDPRDALVLAAFHAHQRRDKGFGPAAGPQAAAALSRLLATAGCKLVEGDSDWRLTQEDSTLVRALADGVAAACAETGMLDARAIESWRAARENADVAIGHTDIFAAFA